jgi:hypothetical protein
MKAVWAGLCVTCLLAPTAWAAKSADSAFDAPLKTQKVRLSPNEVGYRTKLTCRYYARFMVKEVDEGEVGAAQLSILPIGGSGPKPACQRKNVPSEKVVRPRDWSGYVKGVKGDYVFLDADDGVNGGLGFAIFAASTAKKLFEDSAVGNLKSVTLDGRVLALRYARSYSSECSVPRDGAGCWSKIAVATGQTAAKQPDCAAGYLKAKNEMAKGRCEAEKKTSTACLAAALKELDRQRWNEAPSVVVYDAEMVLRPDGASTKPLAPVRTCHPSD